MWNVDIKQSWLQLIYYTSTCYFGYNFRIRTKGDLNMSLVRKKDMLLLILKESADVS